MVDSLRDFEKDDVPFEKNKASFAYLGIFASKKLTKLTMKHPIATTKFVTKRYIEAKKRFTQD